MKIALIIIGVIVLACIALKIVSKISAKSDRMRWDNMTPDERRKYQEGMYKRQQMV